MGALFSREMSIRPENMSWAENAERDILGVLYGTGIHCHPEFWDICETNVSKRVRTTGLLFYSSPRITFLTPCPPSIMHSLGQRVECLWRSASSSTPILKQEYRSAGY